MRAYSPPAQFNVPMRLLVPSVEIIQGVTQKIFSSLENSALFFGSFRTFGGTENLSNGVHTLISTATVDTWYRPDIKPDCRIFLCDTGEIYDIISDPENIDRKNQYLQFKVRKSGGTA